LSSISAPTREQLASHSFPGDKLRIALIVSGAVALGSYEAGALSALIGLVGSSKGRIVIDTIVGASAGSITGLLLAHALLTGQGLDDEQTLWVEQTDMERLLRGVRQPGRPRGPMSSSELEAWALGELGRTGQPVAGTEEIYAVFSVANLQGLTYLLSMHSKTEAVRADTYRDAVAFDFRPDTPADTWMRAMRAAIASSAHAFAFSAAWLDRDRAEYPPEIQWPPDTDGFWYTDGGTVYNEPFGFALDAVFSPEDMKLPARNFDEKDRLFLLIHPHPNDPLAKWPPGGGEPLFGRSSLRAFNMQREQSLYEDLQRLEKYNGRLRWRRDLEDRLREHGGAEEEWVVELAREVKRARNERLLATKGVSGSEDVTADEAIGVVLDAATGTSGKQLAWVETVSPEVDPRIRAGTARVRDLLAGEGLGHFLGFADERARRSDFRLGYENFREWWEGTPGKQGFRTLCDVEGAVPPRDWTGWDEFGSFSLKDVPSGKRWRWGLKLLWRYIREIRALFKGARKPSPRP